MRAGAGTEGAVGPKSFILPAYPYDRLVSARQKAEALPGGVVDLSIGTPRDPPPARALEALAAGDDDGLLRGYPPSPGGRALRTAAGEYMARRFGVQLEPSDLAVCVGTKEFVATLPQWLKLRHPERDTVLFPEMSYPTYAMGAVLAGLRAVPVAMDKAFRMDLDSVQDSDAERALVLWANSPGNPAGAVEDLRAIATWGRDRTIPVFSDECYAEFTWNGPPQTILAGGSTNAGVIAVQSLSKRSNLAGARVGWYAGDAELVHYLSEVRKHAGFMVPGPIQAAAVAALGDHEHVEVQRSRYRDRLALMGRILSAAELEAPMPEGGFYLWVPAPSGDAWALTDRLAAVGGLVVSPGEFYGSAGSGFVRLALVEDVDRLRLVGRRLGLGNVE